MDDSVALDYADIQSLEAAMQGISTLFMVLPNHPDMITWGKNVIDTAKKCGIKHIVRSGGSLADGNSSINLMMDLNQCIRDGIAEATTTTVKDVTGDDAISFEQFVHGNKGAWL